MSRAMVIDASVARASGGLTGNSYSQAALEILTRVLEGRYPVLMSARIRDEWNRHQSRFARQWRTSMMARRLISVDEPPQNEGLRRILAANEEGIRELRVAKDLHLVEGAIYGGGVLITLDNQLRADLAALNPNAHNQIRWVNPQSEYDLDAIWRGR